MERLGLPTASIITHVFNNTAKAMTRMMGVPEFEYIVAEHPLSSLTDEECRERAETLFPDVERILVGSTAAKSTSSRYKPQTHIIRGCLESNKTPSYDFRYTVRIELPGNLSCGVMLGFGHLARSPTISLAFAVSSRLFRELRRSGDDIYRHGSTSGYIVCLKRG